MKNIFPLLLSVVAALFVSGCSQTIPQKSEINQEPTRYIEIQPKTKEYYQSFRETCNESGCCLSSVNNAEQANSLLYKSDSLNTIVCEEGFIPTMNRCPESYKWCTPS